MASNQETMPRNVPEINVAIELLEEFEKHLPATSPYLDNFIVAFNELSGYMGNHPETPHKRYIQNVRLSYARRLLQSLRVIDSSDVNEWFNVLVALIKAKDECDILTSEYADLKTAYEKFLMEWQGTHELEQIRTALLK